MNINFNNKTIEITKSFANKARRYGSDEYKMLCDAQQNFSSFRLVVKTASPKKDGFKGLTYEFMRKYIMAHDEQNSNLDTFNTLVKGSDDSADAESKLYRSYGEVKKWFLETYPIIGNYYANTDKILKKTA